MNAKEQYKRDYALARQGRLQELQHAIGLILSREGLIIPRSLDEKLSESLFIGLSPRTAKALRSFENKAMVDYLELWRRYRQYVKVGDTGPHSHMIIVTRSTHITKLSRAALEKIK